MRNAAEDTLANVEHDPVCAWCCKAVDLEDKRAKATYQSCFLCEECARKVEGWDDPEGER
jgi:dissimilatory sulfite reductase (desulfoviridin) alpha/beta subunit